ncbi:hypothetical protein HDV02_006491 [Globomyces sp. JEL0801]|nr:hypothetical protein HDV02_006491 [Globomyces sp. JEL0801]
MAAQLLFQSTWMAGNCGDAPSAMYVFSENNATNAYTFVTSEYKLPTCGNNPKQKPTGCCYSSLNISDSVYQSMSHHFIKDTVTPTQPIHAPTTANGVSYCYLAPNNATSLYGLKQAYYKADGACYDSNIRCLSTGQLQVFPQSNCVGTPSELKLTSSSSTQSLPVIGSVSGQFVTVQGGATSYSWTAFTPSSVLVPNYSVTMEVAENICFLFAILGALATIVYLAYKYFNRKTNYMFWLLMSQVIWLIWIGSDAVYYNMIFPDTNSFEIYSEIKNVLFSVATLTTVLNTTNFLSTFLRVNKKSHKYVLFGAVCIAHVVLCGGKYFDYFRLQQGAGGTIQKWQLLAPFWILCMFVYNTAPSFYVTLAIIQADSNYNSAMEAFRELHRADKKFSILVFTQILNSIAYFAMAGTQAYTESLLNDRNFLAINGPIDLCFTIHSIINCLFIEHVRVVLKIRSQLSDSRSKTQSAHTRSIYNDKEGTLFKETTPMPSEILTNSNRTAYSSAAGYSGGSGGKYSGGGSPGYGGNSGYSTGGSYSNSNNYASNSHSNGASYSNNNSYSNNSYSGGYSNNANYSGNGNNAANGKYSGGQRSPGYYNQ